MTPEALKPYLRPGTALHDHVLSLMRQRATLAHNAISTRFDRWNQVERALRLYVRPEDVDRLSKELPFSPQGIYVPYLYAQGKALETQYWSMLAHREHIVPIEPRSPEDVLPGIKMSLHLDWQIANTRSLLEMWAWIKACMAFGGAAIKRRFVRHRAPVWRNYQGVNIRIEELVYEGNELTLIDPYRMLPDPSFPFSDATTRGEFFGYTYDLGHDRLEHMVDESGWINVPALKRRVKAFTRSDGIWLVDGRFNTARNAAIGAPEPEGDLAGTSIFEGASNNFRQGNHTVPHRMTEFWWRCVPQDLMAAAKAAGVPERTRQEFFGSRKAELWTTTIGDGAVVVELDPWTQQVNPPIYTIEADPDLLSQFNPGPLELMIPAQIQANWLWHTHIDDRRRHIRPDILIDPKYVELDHVLAPGGGRVMMRTREGSGQPLENVFAQVARGDTTASGVNDMHELLDFHERLGGAGPNMMGQAETGRRTATETSRKNQVGAARVAMAFEIMSHGGMRDLFLGMIQDTQRFMSQETWIRVLGGVGQELGYLEQQGQIDQSGGRSFVSVSPDQIQGNFDFGVMDGSPDMNGPMASPLWMQVIGVSGQHPMLAQSVDVRRVFTQLLRTLGIRNPSQFFLDRTSIPGMPPSGGAEMPPPDVQVVPPGDTDELFREEERGNLVGVTL